jgi:hypothetical protein
MATKPLNKASMPCNKPKRTPGHPKKSHVVKACENGKEKVIRFGEQGAKTAGKPKANEPEAMKAKRASFKARHASTRDASANDSRRGRGDFNRIIASTGNPMRT